MALAIYVSGSRNSEMTLAQLGLEEKRDHAEGRLFEYHWAVVQDIFSGRNRAMGTICGKKYVLPPPYAKEADTASETYPDFVVGIDAKGQLHFHTCDPEKLANNFGANPDAAHYLTPVFFRTEVLLKYYNDPGKYSVEDGYLRCGGLWGLQIDNDLPDCLSVFLGDLGRDLPESERMYWRSFNIPPHGREISSTNFKRNFLAQFADPERLDLSFKHGYKRFNEDFRQASGWQFFLPLHEDDQHFFTALRLPASNNQAEFDSQLLALTKVLVDSLNEEHLANGLTLEKGAKGITKLEQFLSQNGLTGYEPHIKFLRVLQDLRSKSAVHRKGTNYERIVAGLKLQDSGQQKVFGSLLSSSVSFLEYLRSSLLESIPFHPTNPAPKNT